jgi:hypothetical protein
MTFEKWQGAKKRVSVEAEDVRAYPFAEGTTECFVYPGGLLIEIRENATRSGASPARYLLQLPMEEEVSEDLPWLERRLWDFGVSENSFLKDDMRKYSLEIDADEVVLLMNALEVVNPDEAAEFIRRDVLLTKLRGVIG